VNSLERFLLPPVRDYLLEEFVGKRVILLQVGYDGFLILRVGDLFLLLLGGLGTGTDVIEVSGKSH